MDEILTIYLTIGLIAGWYIYSMDESDDDDWDVDGIPLPVFLGICALVAPFAVALLGIKLFERYF